MTRLDCLECVVGGTRLLVPVRDLECVVEYYLAAPPPHSEPWVGGLGLLDQSVYVSLALSGEPRGPRPSSKGLLLRTPGSGRRYAVQVDDVRAIWTVTADSVRPATVPAWPCPPAWLCASLEAAEPVLRLDVDALTTSLFGAFAS